MYCSRRGLCDYNTGTCTCFPGFGGSACSNITYIETDVHNQSSITPGMAVQVHGNDYVSTALSVTAQKGSDDDFYLMEHPPGSSIFGVMGWWV